MITNKELQYVNDWATKIPMPGVDYSIKVLNSIKDCLMIWNEKYKDKDYNIIFSNGEEINFKIYNFNLCHMFGIDYQNVKKECFDLYRKEAFGTNCSDFTSYDLLLMIMDNIEKVAELDNNPDNRRKAINYYKAAIKCEIFNKLSDFERFNYAAINSLTDDTEDKKMLFVPSNESICPYFSMGLIKTADKYDSQEINQYYAVNTLLAMSEPKKFFDDREVIIPTQMLISDNKNLKKISATADEKIRLLTMYKSIVEKYKVNSKINIYGDYETILNDISNKLVLK